MSDFSTQSRIEGLDSSTTSELVGILPKEFAEDLQYFLARIGYTADQLQSICYNNQLRFRFVEKAPYSGWGIDGAILVEKKGEHTELTLLLSSFQDLAYRTEEFVHLLHYILNRDLRQMVIEQQRVVSEEDRLRAQGVTTDLAVLDLSNVEDKIARKHAQIVDILRLTDIDSVSGQPTASEIANKICSLPIANKLSSWFTLLTFSAHTIDVISIKHQLLKLFTHQDAFAVNEWIDQEVSRSNREKNGFNTEQLLKQIQLLLARVSNDQSALARIDIASLDDALEMLINAIDATEITVAEQEAILLAFTDDLPADAEQRAFLLSNPDYLKSVRDLVLDASMSPASGSAVQFGVSPVDLFANSRIISKSDLQRVPPGEAPLIQLMRQKTHVLQSSYPPEIGWLRKGAESHLQQVAARLQLPLEHDEVRSVARAESVRLNALQVQAEILKHTLDGMMEPVAKIYATMRWRQESSWAEYQQQASPLLYSDLLRLNDPDNLFLLCENVPGFFRNFLQARSLDEQADLIKASTVSQPK